MKNILISIAILTLFGCSDKDTVNGTTKITETQFKQGYEQLVANMDAADEEHMTSKSEEKMTANFCEISFIAEDTVKYLKDNNQYLTTEELKKDLEFNESLISFYKTLAKNSGQDNCQRTKDYYPKFQ